MLDQCPCYRSWPGDPKYKDTYPSRCMGTSHMDVCKCEGKEENCDFYPDVRKRAVEMTIPKNIPAKLECIAHEIRQLDLNGYYNQEIKRLHILDELNKIKEELKKEDFT